MNSTTPSNPQLQDLQDEGMALRQLHSKIAEQLHRLQVEEVGLKSQIESYRKDRDNVLGARVSLGQEVDNGPSRDDEQL